MDALVTGGTGFIGANVVRALLADGRSVRVLARKSGDRRALAGCAVEIVEGDLLDPSSLRAAARGARHVYHVAADYRLWAPDPRALYRANVDGTRHVLEAACEAGAERIVYTSTVGAVGIPHDGTPGDETTPVSLHDMVGAYKASKFLAERVAEELAARGAPIVVVNPSAPVGPLDVKPTPTGQMIVDFLLGRMVASLDTGLNLVHVRDVARGHLLAAERGRAGERYILGHRNLSLMEIFQLLARITGIRAPRVRVPYAAAWLAALGMEGVSRLTGRAPRASLTAVRMARKRMHFSAAKAVRDLGLPQTPVDVALADAVSWFVEEGYAPRPPRFEPPSRDESALTGRDAARVH
jgi:dihydroflavonol-4-reductase